MQKRRPVARKAVTHLLVFVSVLSTIALLIQGCVPFVGGGVLSPGTEAPAIAAQFRDESPALEQLAGQPVLINFWSST